VFVTFSVAPLLLASPASCCLHLHSTDVTSLPNGLQHKTSHRTDPQYLHTTQVSSHHSTHVTLLPNGLQLRTSHRTDPQYLHTTQVSSHHSNRQNAIRGYDYGLPSFVTWRRTAL